MKLATLLLLLLMGATAPVVALPDEPGKTQPEASKPKVRKASKKNRAPLFARRKAKESDYNRAMRRNELLRQDSEPTN